MACRCDGNSLELKGAQLGEYTQNHWVVNFKMANFMAYELYLNFYKNAYQETRSFSLSHSIRPVFPIRWTTSALQVSGGQKAKCTQCRSLGRIIPHISIWIEIKPNHGLGVQNSGMYSWVLSDHRQDTPTSTLLPETRWYSLFLAAFTRRKGFG